MKFSLTWLFGFLQTLIPKNLIAQNLCEVQEKGMKAEVNALK